MQKLLYGLGIIVLISTIACNKSDAVDSKPGVSLPAVTNLTLQKVSTNKVTLNWQVPTGIPAEIEQPLNVIIQVTEFVSMTKWNPIANFNLPNAPVTFNYDIPDPAKVYHFIVKLNGRTKTVDKNYSSNITSPGQTVEYKN